MAKNFFSFAFLLSCLVAIGALYESAPLISHLAAYFIGVLVMKTIAE